MNKITSLTSEDLVAQNITTLKKLFPTIVKEGEIDFKELESLLKNDVVEGDEYYRFTWAGKSQARLEANKPSTATLRPDKASSKNWDTTKNIFIEGDNLEVLKLLQKSYANRIKMIYIDPPYNTGKDFVYKDNYTDNLGNYLSLTGQTDEEGKKLSTNTESDGRYHSNWLNMMYPRLRLARNLMTDDGVIFISIDDNEVHNLRKLCDEVFGEENFAGQWNWYKSATPPNLSKKIKKNIEYILGYQKRKNDLIFKGIHKFSSSDDPLTKPQNTVKDLVFPPYSMNTTLTDGLIEKGTYGTAKYPNDLLNDLIVENGTNKNEVTFRNKFVWTQPKLDEELTSRTVINLSKSLVISYKKADYGEEVPPNYIDEKVNVTTTENAGKELISIFDDKKVFDYPKPVSLIEYLINFLCEKNDIVLDFFAGSGTTGESTFLHNSEKNKSLRFILVQLNELLDIKNATSESERQVIENAIAFLTKIEKPTNIAEITKERIRRAGEKIIAEQKELLEKAEKELAAENARAIKDGQIVSDLESKIQNLKSKIQNLDIGFKAFKLDSSNIRPWDGNPENLEDQLFTYAQNIKENRTEEDILFEVLLKYGLDLAVPIEEKSVAGKTVYNVGAGTMFICLSDNITPEISEAIGQWKEELQPAISRVIFKDSGFATDKDKTNAVQILKRFGIEEANSI